MVEESEQAQEAPQKVIEEASGLLRVKVEHLAETHNQLARLRRRLRLIVVSLLALSAIASIALFFYYASHEVVGEKTGVLIASIVSNMLVAFAGYALMRKRESSMEKDIEIIRKTEREFFKNIDESIHSRVSKVS
jgi:uncharacterized membrane protein